RPRREAERGVDLGEAAPEERLRRVAGERPAEDAAGVVELAERALRPDGEHALVRDPVDGPAEEVERGDGEADLARQQPRRERERPRVVPERAPEVAVLGLAARP